MGIGEISVSIMKKYDIAREGSCLSFFPLCFSDDLDFIPGGNLSRTNIVLSSRRSFLVISSVYVFNGAMEFEMIISEILMCNSLFTRYLACFIPV